MSHCNVPIHAMLFPAEDIDGVWCSWCPEFDIVSQGDGPDHAIGMLSDVIRLCAEDDLLSFGWETMFPGDPLREELVRTRKRVRHPLRRGGSAREDENWVHFETYRGLMRDWRRVADIETHRMDPAMGRGIVHGDLSIHARGGIVHCDISFSDYVIVPARNFDVRVRVTSERDMIVSIPTAVLADGSPLRSAGMSAESIVLGEANRRARDLGAEVVSIAERPLAKLPA